MGYSSIKIKPCKCGCGFSQTFNCGGYYYAHMPSQMIAEKTEAKANQQKKSNAKKREMVQVRSLANNIDEDQIKLQRFFAAAAIELARNPYCIECKAKIPSAFFRAATAHVLPKRKEYGFPSIAAHPANKLFLGAGCGCHSKYDSSWEAASKMKVWPLAVAIFKELYPFISEEEKKNIPQILLDTLPKPKAAK